MPSDTIEVPFSKVCMEASSSRKRKLGSFDSKENAKLSDLVVPIVMWHAVPVHPISAIAISPSGKYIVSGDVGGRLVIWDLLENNMPDEHINVSDKVCRPSPRTFCVGHSAYITSITFGIHQWGMEVFVSLSAEGSVGVWSLDDGRCLGQRTNFFGHNGLGPCLSVTNISTFYDLHFAIVTGQSSHFEVINLSSLETVWGNDVGSGEVWINDIACVRRVGKDEHVSFSPTISLMLGSNRRLFSFTMAESRDNSGKSEFSSLKDWVLHWPSHGIKSETGTTGPDVIEEDAEDAMSDDPRRLCTSPDDQTVAIFGRHIWGLLRVSWLDGNESSTVPVVIIRNGEFSNDESPVENGFDKPAIEAGTFLRDDVILIWLVSGKGYIYRINECSELGKRDRVDTVTLLSVLNVEAERHNIGMDATSSICRLSHATKAFPSKFQSTGYNLGNCIYIGGTQSPKSSENQRDACENVISVFACNGLDQIKSWKINLDSPPTKTPKPPMVIGEVSDGFFNKEKMNKCTAALIVHDDGINGLSGIPAVMIRAYSDGSMHFSSLPYDQNPLIVNCQNDSTSCRAVASSPRQHTKRSKKKTRCLAMACPFWARQRSTKGQVCVTRLLICGCSDGTLRIWTFTLDTSAVKSRTPPYISAKLCYSYHGHRGHIIDVSAALPRNLLINSSPKDQTFHKNAGFQDKLLCSVGKDRGIVLYAVTLATREHLDVNVLHFFRGHPSPISAVQWRLNAGLLVAVCNNGVALVWGLQSGQMERRVSAQALDIPYSRNSYIYMNKTYNASSNCGIWKGSVDDLVSQLRYLKGLSHSKLGSDMDEASFNEPKNSDFQSKDVSFSSSERQSKVTSSNSLNEGQTRPRVFSLTPVPGTSNVQNKQERGHLIGPTLVNIDKSAITSSQSDKSSAVSNDCMSESPVQVVKVEGSNRLCSRGGASPDVILVSIAAVAKRASVNTSANSINKAGDQKARHNELQSNWHSDMNLAIVAYLLSWGLDADIDEMCLKELGLKAPDLSEGVSFALRSAGGALTMSLPKSCVDLKRWQVSPEMSALHSLALVSLFMSLMSAQSRQGGLQQGFFSKLITHYGIIFPERLKSIFVEPSLSTLAHYGLDAWEDGHVSARLLLQGTIERMAEHTRIAQASEWAARLHHAESIWQKEEEDRRAQQLAQEAYIARLNAEQLGLLGDEDRISLSEVDDTGKNGMRVEQEVNSNGIEKQPSKGQKLPSRRAPLEVDASGNSTKNVDSSDGTSSSASSNGFGTEAVRRVVSSIGLKIRGKTKDANNLDSQQKLQTDPERDVMVLILSVIGVTFPQDIAPPTARLVTSTLLYHLNYGNEIFAALAAELLGKGFALWRPHIPRLAGLIRRLLSLALYAEFYGGKRSKNIDGTETQGVSVAAAAQRALLEIGAFQPMLFISTVGEEMLRPDTSDEYHRTSIMAMVALVKKRPLSLSRHLSAVVEAVIKSLDPSKPLLRKACLQASTKALHELVKRFPVVAFHQRSQRFAVGTSGKVIVIYDLRTATKWRLLEGHKGIISALAFAPDGTSLASYSLEEKCVKTWQAGSSGWMGGILGLSAKCIKTIPLTPINTATTAQDALLKCRIQWMSPKQLKLRRENGKLTALDI